jgi:outer membrane protein
MKKYLFLFGLIAAGNSFSQDTLSLEQIVSRVLESNYDVRIERNNAQLAENLNNIGTAGYLPSIGIIADQNWSSNNTRQEFFSGVVNEAQGAKNRSTNAQARLDWTFFDGFRMFAADKRLQLQEDAARYQLTAEMEMQIYQAAATYYSLVQAQELLPVYLEAIGLSKMRYDIVDLKLRNGAGTELELLQARLDLSADSSLLLQHQKYMADLRVDLNTLMGQNPDSPLLVTGVLTPQTTLTWQNAWEQAKAQNTQLLIAKSAIAITEMQEKEARSAYYPQLGVYGEYGYSSQSNQIGLLRSSRTLGAGAGITLRWTILDRLATYTTLRNFDLYRNSAEIAAQQQELLIASELRKTFNEYEWALRNYQLEQQSILNTTEAFEIARFSYENGSLTNLELREIQYSIVQAQSRLSNAKLTLKTAELNLSLTTGDFQRLLN